MSTRPTVPLRAPVTVLLPTHDHAGSLPYAARSVLEQTMGDLALVVVGDGVGDDTRDVVADLRAADERVVFVDRPKGERHGEVLRHEVLAHVESPVIGYHGDDDLLLPTHLERMLETLADRDFAHPLPVVVRPGEDPLELLPTDLGRPECVRWHLGTARRNAVSLTGVVHTHESYRRLPHGWRAAPAGEWTDHHMWRQFFALDGFRGVTGASATTIKLVPGPDRAAYDGDAAIAAWWQRMREPGFDDWWAAKVDSAVRRAAVDATLERDALVDRLAALQAAHDEAVAQRDRALAAHDRAVEQREVALASRDRAVTDRDKAIVREERALRQRDQARQARDRARERRDREAEQDRPVGERDGSLGRRMLERLRGRATTYDG